MGGIQGKGAREEVGRGRVCKSGKGRGRGGSGGREVRASPSPLLSRGLLSPAEPGFRRTWVPAPHTSGSAPGSSQGLSTGL